MLRFSQQGQVMGCVVRPGPSRRAALMGIICADADHELHVARMGWPRAMVSISRAAT